MDRRTFIRGMCAGGVATFTSGTLSLATVPGSEKLVFVLLRGGLDGLSAVVPYGDRDYQDIRGALAFKKADLAVLDDQFGLAPGFHPLKKLWDQGELAVVHAMAIPYRTRSHFDGQAILETGLDAPRGSSDGWLNRLLQVMEGNRSGIAVAAGLPLSLSGTHAVKTWSPAKLGVVDDGYVDRLHVLYRHDPRLLDRFEAALQMPEVGMMGTSRRAGRQQIELILGATARFLREPDGPNVAAVEFSGWDTHANQGQQGGQLDRLLGQLARGILNFKSQVGSTWNQTTVVVMTEFGRTARPNGTGGTDHGTAGAGFVIGPRLSRSRVLSDWPGLANKALYENRDLRPTLDTRTVLKTVVAGCFDLNRNQLNRIFPGADHLKELPDLMS